MIEVKINGVVKWQVNEYTFVDPQMGLRSISLTVTHPSDNATVPSFVGAYVEYNGERYDIVNSKPTAEKGIDSINYKYNLIFNGQEAELQKRKIRNLATVGVDTFISQGTSFSLYADINQFKQLLENNLKYYFGNKWTINLGSTTSESVMVSVNNMFIWDLLLKTFEYYGLRWNITGNTINIGYTPDVIQHVFDYGYDGGLVKITRTAQSEPTINRLIGVGGSRNVPINYFTNRYSDFPVDPNPISGDVSIKNIMPKVFRDSVIAGTLPYIDYVEDAALVAADGVKEDALEPNEEIYPSIAGVEVTGLGRIDQIIDASVPTANTPDDAGYSPTFDIWVKDIGFDLADNQYTTTQDAKISFTSGMLSGYEFVILATNGVRNVVVDTSKSYGGVASKYKITLINSSEDFTATGRMLPNSVIKAMAGDSFVIYDIIMPQTYVELAELRVQNWLNEQLLVKKVEKPTYAIEPTDTFFEENIAPESDGKTIREKLKSGNKLTVNNTKVTDGAQELHINNITIQYGGLLPKYSFVVTDKVSVQGSVTQRIQSSVRTVELKQSEISNKVGAVYSSSHSHHNKEIIDQILQQHLDVLGVLSIVDGDLEIDANAYSTGELSAYGAGTGGGGGGGIIETVYGSSNLGSLFSDSTLTDTFNAYTVNWIHERVQTLEAGGGGGGGSTVEWGTLTNGYRQLTVEGVTYALAQNTHKHLWADITDKPSTFAPSAHTHSAGDITSGTFTIARIPTGTTASTVALGNHLHTGVYEPVFSKNTAFNKNFGTDSGTVAQGNDSRITNGQTAYGWGNHATAGYALNSSLSNYVPTSRTITAGNGLSGGGTLAADRTITLGTPSNITLSSTNSVTTASHTHNFTLGGTASQYLNGATALVTIPTVTAGNGLTGGGQLTSGITLTLATPGTLTAETANGVTASSHTHAITTTSVGAANTIVQTDASGGTKLNNLKVGGDWKLEQVGTELQLKYNNVVAQRFLLDGSIVGLGEITAYGASTGGEGVALLRTGGTMTGDLVLDANLGIANKSLTLLGNSFKYNGSNILTEANTSNKITMGNGWTIEQTSANLTIRKNGVIKGTFNA